MSLDYGSWQERIANRKIVFEITGYAITTVTWVSLCIVTSLLVIRGYFEPDPPALVSLGLPGKILSNVFYGSFLLIAAVSSLVVFCVFYSLILDLKRDVEARKIPVIGGLLSVFGYLWHYIVICFITILIIIVSMPIYQAIQ